MRGFTPLTSAYPMPSRSATPGRKLSTITSASRNRFVSRSRPSDCLRSRTTLRLFRLSARNGALSSPFICNRRPPIARERSPSGGSTLMTSAPRSASNIVQNGPAMTCDRSTTRTPSSGVVTVDSSGSRRGRRRRRRRGGTCGVLVEPEPERDRGEYKERRGEERHAHAQRVERKPGPERSDDAGDAPKALLQPHVQSAVGGVGHSREHRGHAGERERRA